MRCQLASSFYADAWHHPDILHEVAQLVYVLYLTVGPVPGSLSQSVQSRFGGPLPLAVTALTGIVTQDLLSDMSIWLPTAAMSK